MKKIISTLALLLCAALAVPSFAIETGEYTWRGYTVTLKVILERARVAAVDMTADQRAIGFQLEVPEDVARDNALRNATYSETLLVDEDGQTYPPCAVMSMGNTFTYLYVVPKDMDTAQLRLVFEKKGDATAQPLTLKDFLGRWSAEEKQFIFRDAITWGSTAADIRALLGEENVGVSENDGVTTVFGRGSIPLAQGEIGDHAAVFWKNQLAQLVFAIKDDTLDDAELYDKIVSGLTELYGAPNAEDFSLFSGHLAAYMENASDTLREVEKTPWKAWLLPDQTTLVFSTISQGSGVIFINLDTPSTAK